VAVVVTDRQLTSLDAGSRERIRGVARGFAPQVRGSPRGAAPPNSGLVPDRTVRYLMQAVGVDTDPAGLPSSSREVLAVGSARTGNDTIRAPRARFRDELRAFVAPFVECRRTRSRTVPGA
jgi:hypothetical protein